MDREELREHLAEVEPGTPYFEVLVMDDSPSAAGFACNHCGADVTHGLGCPEHAPQEIPGLVRSHCDAIPPHAPVWVLDGDHCGYGVGCPACQDATVAEQLAKATRCRHWGWRRWALTRRISCWGYTIGITTGACYTFDPGPHGCDGCISGTRVRGKRTYILGIRREVWRCWLVGHHRRGIEVGYGNCGKCVPWPCCGSQQEAHVPGCPEDAEQVIADRARLHAEDGGARR